MKKLFTLFVIATIALSHSCTKSGIEDDAMNGNKIKLSATQVEVDFEGETECKVVVNSPCSWEAESKNDWLNVVTKQGVAGAKELFFYADNNYDLKKREGTIVVTNRDYGYIDELYVTQKGFVPSIQYPETMTFDSKGGYQNITITANCSWEYSDDASWLTLSRTSSGLKVTATECTSTSERTATITLSNSNYKVSKQIKVTQKAFEPTLEIDKTELNFDVNGGSKTVYVTTNAEFNFSESSSWISCSKSSNRVTITVSASDVTEERSAEVEIYLTNYNLTQTIKVSQKKFVPEFEVKTTELDFEAEGGTKTISVSANFDYSVSESADWLSYQVTSSGVKLTTTANVEEKERTADVKIYNNTYGKSATVKVTQKKFVPELSLAKSELKFESIGGTQDIAVTSNFDYQVTTNVDWLTCNKTGSGISVVAAFYDMLEDRSAEITVFSNKYSLSKTIKVLQKKFVLEFEVGVSELNFEANGGTQTIPVTANFEYSVSENADWLSYTKTSSGVKLTATANVEEKENSAEVKIYNSKYGVSKTVYVKQDKFVPEFQVSVSELAFGIDGGTQTIPITANFDYSISESADWLSYTKTSSGVKLTASINTAENERVAEVKIYNDKYNQSSILKVTQMCPILVVENVSSLEFDYTGGEKTIGITANFDYDVTTVASWVVCEKLTNGVKISIPQNRLLKENRTTEVIIYSERYNKSISISLTQSPYPYKIGDIVTVDGVKGVIFYIDTSITKIVSVNETKAAWSTEFVSTGAKDVENGANNMAIITKISGWEVLYPAFKWCYDYGRNWYFPAIYELKEIYIYRVVINSALQANNFTTINTSTRYTSSTEGNAQSPIQLDFSNGKYEYLSYKCGDNGAGHHNIRAVCAF